ncbi:hypothetical protein [Nocardioides sp.]|uniref:hypothetical protein n=1 Tax=Nocardioides sp. TaxID=35761 RepID=UPI003D0FCCB2
MTWFARGVAVAAALVVVPFTAAPSQAALARTYTKSAVVELVEMGAMPGAPGNAHYGHLEFYSSSDGSAAVRGYVFHFDCPAGFEPTRTPDFTEAAGELERECTFFEEGTESLESGEVRIRMTKDQAWTHVEGYFDGSLAGQPTVDFSLTLRGFGEVTETHSVTRFPGYKQRTRDRERAASVTGTIGGLGLGDEPDDLRFVGQVHRVRFLTATW